VIVTVALENDIAEAAVAGGGGRNITVPAGVGTAIDCSWDRTVAATADRATFSVVGRGNPRDGSGRPAVLASVTTGCVEPGGEVTVAEITM
jgi:hypothetical protein